MQGTARDSSHGKPKIDARRVMHRRRPQAVLCGQSLPAARLACLLLVAAGLAACATQPVAWRSAPGDTKRVPMPATIVLASVQTPKPSLLPPPPPQPPERVAPQWQAIGESVRTQPVLAAQAGSGPLRIYLIGGIHGDETEARSVLQALADEPDPRWTLRIIRDLNPDGTATRKRNNANGFDLNRNWPARNFNPRSSGGRTPLSEPETRAVEADLRAFRPDLVLVLHSISTGPFVNFDGPAAQFASAFVQGARGVNHRWKVRPSMGYPTPGSLGSYLGADRGIPILTAEFRRGQDEAAASRELKKGMQALADAYHTRVAQAWQVGSR